MIMTRFRASIQVKLTAVTRLVSARRSEELEVGIPCFTRHGYRSPWEAQALQWTDRFGRAYRYLPYDAGRIADAEIAFSSDAALAVAEASSSLGSVPALPVAGIDDEGARRVVGNLEALRDAMKTEIPAGRDGIHRPSPR
jgi:hypothetical protein